MGHGYWVQLEDLTVESQDTSELEVSFVLNKSTLELEEDLMVSFDKPLAPRVGEHYVTAAVPAGKLDEYILNNVFGKRGDTGMWLYTPLTPGNRSAPFGPRSQRIRPGHLPLAAGGRVSQADMEPEETEDDDYEGAFDVEKTRFVPGEAIHLTLDPPLFPPERFLSHYITVVPPDDPDESYPQSSASYKTPSRLGIAQREFTFDTLSWSRASTKYRSYR